MAAREDDSPPPLSKAELPEVEESYHTVGEANDLVFVEAPGGVLTVSDFHVRQPPILKTNDGTIFHPFLSFVSTILIDIFSLFSSSFLV